MLSKEARRKPEPAKGRQPLETDLTAATEARWSDEAAAAVMGRTLTIARASTRIWEKDKRTKMETQIQRKLLIII
jgi:hypothetical protein